MGQASLLDALKANYDPNWEYCSFIVPHLKEYEYDDDSKN